MQTPMSHKHLLYLTCSCRCSDSPCHIYIAGALLCDCTEPECLSSGRSNMCQGDPNLGCYKQYYLQVSEAYSIPQCGILPTGK